MPAYTNKSGKSNVASYKFGDDWIAVTFKDGSTYTYTVASAGITNIQAMISLAQAGFGLNSHINRHARKLYARKG